MSDATWPAIVAHRDRLIRIAARRCPTREDAEDVVHEAMLRCATFENLDEARLGQFLTTVTIRLCADVYRRDDRTQRTANRLGPEPVVTHGPEDVACEAADAVVLRGLLARLPDRQRAVLVDRASGLSMTQIARRHSLTYKAAESALSRARGTMRSALASGFSVLTAAAALIRPRRVAVASLPTVGLVVVAATVTVLRLPLVAEPAPAVRAPVLRTSPGEEAAFRSGAATAAASAAARPDSTFRAAAPKAVRALTAAPPTASRKRTVLTIGNDQNVSKNELSEQGEPESPDETVLRCATYGVAGWELEINPTEREVFSFDPYCGHPK